MSKVKLIIVVVVIGGIVIIGIIIGNFWRTTTTSLSEGVLKSRDAMITTDLDQLRSVADMLKIENGNYDKFNKNQEYVKAFSEHIAENEGVLILQKPSPPASEFCAYSRLNMKRDGSTSWFCIDSSGAKCYLTIDPSATCNQNSFVCSCP